MTTKLNLTIEESTIKRIKRYASKKNTSVSKLTEEYFNKILDSNERSSIKKSFVERTAGLIKGKSIDIDVAKDDYLKKKYGL